MIDDEMIHDVPPSDESPAAQPAAETEAPLIDTREAEIEALTAQVAELKNAVLRERADQENLRKRWIRSPSAWTQQKRTKRRASRRWSSSLPVRR